ncbi:hypothetical protein KSP39_PZI009216 [Platanthera zijinensis]|uniref:Uncharacterized protein n=1 Tax=Platanthera zijinensis TaxID=2320716 RepID=A0AAP0G851_9ASPA
MCTSVSLASYYIFMFPLTLFFCSSAFSSLGAGKSEIMAGLILEVDLQCNLCKKKIKKVLRKLEDREEILPPKYNEEDGTVTVTGPFDPKKLSKKLCCKACKVIKKITILVEKPDKPPPPSCGSHPPDPPVSPEKPKPECIYLYPYPYPYPQPCSYPCPVVWPLIPLCRCNGSCQCKSIVDPPPAVHPAPAPICATPCYDGCRSCRFICEEEPSACSIM